MTWPFSLRATVVTALQQIALAAAVSVLVIGWLHVPDANAFEVFGSLVLALLIVVVGCGGESAIALRLTDRPLAVRRLLFGVVVVFVTALLWYAATTGTEHLAGEYEARWAGYLNSRASASMRNFLSYEHYMLWFGWAKFAVDWALAGLLAAVAFAVVTCNAPLRAFGAIVRSGYCWLSLLLFAVVGGWLTWTILGWTPGHGLRLEAFSLVLRLVIVVLLNVLAVALLLQTMARAVLHVQSAGGAGPETTQPRTVPAP